MDTRIITKPKSFDGTEGQWQDWKFGFQNYMACVDPEYVTELEAAATAPGSLVGQVWPAPTTRRSTALYAVLASLLQHRPLGLL